MLSISGGGNGQRLEPANSATSRDTMLFNNESRVEQDPDHGPRLVMEQMLKLS